MDNEDVILEQMADTRSALTEKLETLENKVASTVGNAASDVAQTVEAVKETVQETVATVKETVEQTIGAVKDSVKDSVHAVQGIFDVPAYVDRQPWIMFAGSMAVGFALGKMLMPREERSAPEASSYSGASGGSGTSHRTRKNGRAAAYESKDSSTGGGILSQLAPELDKLKGMAIGTLMGTVKEMVVPAVPESIRDSAVEIIDSVTQKLGGKPIDQGKKEESHGSEGESESKQEPLEMQSRWARSN